MANSGYLLNIWPDCDFYLTELNFICVVLFGQILDFNRVRAHSFRISVSNECCADECEKCRLNGCRDAAEQLHFYHHDAHSFINVVNASSCTKGERTRKKSEKSIHKKKKKIGYIFPVYSLIFSFFDNLAI